MQGTLKIDNAEFESVEKELLRFKKKIREKPIIMLYVVFCMLKFIYKRTIENINSLQKIKNYIFNGIYFFKIKFFNFGRPIFYVIGDSHVREYNRIFPFVSIHLGALTAYNLIEKESYTDSNRKLLKTIRFINRKKDYLILSAGEIDARVHVNRVFCESRGVLTLQKVIENNISRYFEIIEKLKLMGYKVILLGIPPAATAKNEPGVKHDASNKKRALIYCMFNSLLSKKCNKRGIVYLDIYSYTVDKNGFSLQEYYSDGVHLNNKVVDLTKTLLRNSKLL